MLSKNLLTPCNIIDHISLYHFWANALPPLLPIVADGSQLSICYLKKVMPELLKVGLYQLSAKIQQNPSLTHQTLSQVTDKNSFTPEFFTALVTKNFPENGINFVTLKQLSKSSPSIFDQWFDDETQKTMIAGVLLEKTHLPLDKLLTIWQTITALAVINLADMISSLQNTIDSAQITEWLAMQPVFFMSPQDTGLMNAVNFRRAVSFQAMQQQQLKWSKIQNITDLPVYQQHIVQQMTIYKASNFFNIAPIAIPHADFNRQVISNGNRQIDKAVTSNTQTALSASNIFAKPQVRKPAHWIDKLQKNWIATATVLSVALVSVKDKPAATQPSAKMSVAHPVYHDVAIVKVASTPSTVTNEMTTAEHHKKHDKSKSLDENPSVQSEKARAMKKSDKQEESKKAESKKDRKKNTNNDAKADGKKEAKQDQKKKASSSKVDSGQSEKTSSTTKKSTTKDKAVKEKSPKEKDKSPSSTTATDKKSARKPDKKANNTTNNKADDKANKKVDNKVDNKVNNEANNKPSNKSKTH